MMFLNILPSYSATLHSTPRSLPRNFTPVEMYIPTTIKYLPRLPFWTFPSRSSPTTIVPFPFKAYFHTVSQSRHQTSFPFSTRILPFLLGNTNSKAQALHQHPQFSLKSRTYTRTFPTSNTLRRSLHRYSPLDIPPHSPLPEPLPTISLTASEPFFLHNFIPFTIHSLMHRTTPYNMDHPTPFSPQSDTKLRVSSSD